MPALVFLFNSYVNLLPVFPTFVMVPVTSYAAPSPFTNPSPLSVTSFFVSGVPSYSFFAEAEVSFTVLFSISSCPSSITNFTLLKLLFVFLKSPDLSSMSYVPASVPFTSAFPLNSKSSFVYSLLLMLFTS